MHFKHKTNIMEKRAAHGPRILSLQIYALRGRCLVSFMELGVFLKRKIRRKCMKIEIYFLFPVWIVSLDNNFRTSISSFLDVPISIRLFSWKTLLFHTEDKILYHFTSPRSRFEKLDLKYAAASLLYLQFSPTLPRTNVGYVATEDNQFTFVMITLSAR